MRIVFVGVFFTLLLGCFIHGIRSNAPPSYSPSSVSSPAVINPSPLDGKANSPNSWHKGHVHAYTIFSGRFQLDDGTFIKLFFTGGTRPEIPVGASGVIYVSVPSFEDDDADNTYYFQKFVPDTQP
jgi:hypothetical protein